MLVTRCPACATAFRIKPEQLGLRGGRVRCGNCQMAFSALNTLEELPDDAPLTVTAPPPPPAAAKPAPPKPVAPAAAPAPKPAPAPAPRPPMVAGMTAREDHRDKPDNKNILPPSQPRAAVSTAQAFISGGNATTTKPSAGQPAKPATSTNAASLAPDFVLDPPEVDVTQTFFDPLPSPDWDSSGFAEPTQPATPSTPPPASAPTTKSRSRKEEKPAESSVQGVLQIDEHFELGSLEADPETEVLRREAGIPDTEMAPEVALDAAPASTRTIQLGERRSRAPWLLLSLLLLIAAAVQGAYFFRTPLARDFPALRPVLEDACAMVGCVVPYPKNTDAITVEGSDLNPIPGQPSRYTLVLTIRNRAPYAQTWPHVELTLTDRFDRALTRKVFAPNEWLPANLRNKPAFEAGDEVTTQVPLAAAGLAADGFRVYVFHP